MSSHPGSVIIECRGVLKTAALFQLNLQCVSSYERKDIYLFWLTMWVARRFLSSVAVRGGFWKAFILTCVPSLLTIANATDFIFGKLYQTPLLCDFWQFCVASTKATRDCKVIFKPSKYLSWPQNTSDSTLQGSTVAGQGYSSASSIGRLLSWSCATYSVRVAGAAGFPWQTSKPSTPLSAPRLSPARRTTGRWTSATLPNSETSFSGCLTTPRRRSWPVSSCWEAESRLTSWSTGRKMDPLKHLRVWLTCRYSNTKAPSQSSIPSSTRWRRRRKSRFNWPNLSDRKLTDPGWRWAPRTLESEILYLSPGKFCL